MVTAKQRAWRKKFARMYGGKRKKKRSSGGSMPRRKKKKRKKKKQRTLWSRFNTEFEE